MFIHLIVVEWLQTDSTAVNFYLLTGVTPRLRLTERSGL